MTNHYIPAALDQILDSILGESASAEERSEVTAILRLIEELNHRRWRQRGIEAMRAFRRATSARESHKILHDQVEFFLQKANFEKISRSDVESALEDKQLFELPLEIDWKAFESEPIIYARGIETEVVESRFFVRKLTYYMIYGSLGVILASLVLLTLGWLTMHAVSRGDVRHSIMATPRFESSSTLGAGDAETFTVFFEDGVERDVKWHLYDSQGQEILADLEAGSPAQLRPDGASVTLLVADRLAGEVRGLSLQAVLEDEGRVVLRRPIELVKDVAPHPLAKWGRILAWVLFGAGGLGLAVGLFNGLRQVTWDEDKRQRKLAKGLEHVRPATRERMMKMRVDRLWHLFRKERLEGEVLSRVVLATQLKDQERPVLKLFRDIAFADIELIFPATRLRMRFKDRLMLGFSIAFAGMIIVVKVIALLSAAFFALWLLVVAFVTAGGLAARTWTKFRNTVRNYTSTLTESLYFRNLDNDEGVLHYLVHHVEEQELKETCLAYWMLYRSENGLNMLQIVEKTNRWLAEKCAVRANFEAEDGVAKLTELGLIAATSHDGAISVHNLADTRANLEAKVLAQFSRRDN